ncbi:DUF1570 domain-containing protein [Sphingomonas endolithica]|uniref:DUF1570 domain-containing protein n=1 Tax=Sphingomonas endolithica TaxID=2972485 RepID=UPI0021AF864B|nr:DUF1570 domain-containing protein [Sphingomonas sp. ZFBP2030]
MSPRLLASLAIAAAALIARPAAAEWREASSDHFLIYADSDERWLTGFAERLERLDSAIRYMRGMETVAGARSNRLTIYVVPSDTAVVNLCGQGCRNVAGFYVPRAGGSIAYTPRRINGPSDTFNADLVLFHEYAHHLMLENFAAAYPRWFVEGFAEFNATAKITPDGAVQIGVAAQHRATGLLFAPAMKVETLLDDSKAKLSPTQQDVFYGRAWLLTHMLTFSEPRQGQLSAYLKLINQGKPSLEAARTAFGDLKALNKDMDAYLRQNKIMGIKLPPDRTKVGAIALRPLSTGEAGTMAVRMRSDRGVSHDQALALLPEARKRAALFPADPAAQAVLAEAEYDAGNDALCESAADRALAADAKYREALLYKGRARLRMAAIAKSRDAKVWKEARSWFVKANRLDPDAAEPLMLFYTSFLAADEKPTTSATNALFRAFDLSPHDSGLRLLVVRQLLVDGDPPGARKVLLPLAYDPHAPADNPAMKLVGMIDAGLTGPAIVEQVDKTRKAAGEDEPSGKGGADA